MSGRRERQVAGEGHLIGFRPRHEQPVILSRSGVISPIAIYSKKGKKYTFKIEPQSHYKN